MLDLDWKEKSKPITELPLHLLTLFCKHQDEEIDYREKLRQSRLLLFTCLFFIPPCCSSPSRHQSRLA